MLQNVFFDIEAAWYMGTTKKVHCVMQGVIFLVFFRIKNRKIGILKLIMKICQKIVF